MESDTLRDLRFRGCIMDDGNHPDRRYIRRCRPAPWMIRVVGRRWFGWLVVGVDWKSYPEPEWAEGCATLRLIHYVPWRYFTDPLGGSAVRKKSRRREPWRELILEAIGGKLRTMHVYRRVGLCDTLRLLWFWLWSTRN